MDGIPADYLNKLRMLPSTEIINEKILASVMHGMRVDVDVFLFCDIMEQLCDDSTSRNLIAVIRHGT